MLVRLAVSVLCEEVGDLFVVAPEHALHLLRPRRVSRKVVQDQGVPVSTRARLETE